jgi:aspartate carbamoyltransferase catalytic subunit
MHSSGQSAGIAGATAITHLRVVPCGNSAHHVKSSLAPVALGKVCPVASEDDKFVRHLLAIEGMQATEIEGLLDLAESYVLLNRSGTTQRDRLRGRTLINLFFEDSTRTRTSFELAGKRLGADVLNMSVSNSSINKGETLLDTASTLNAMHCDLLVVRHDQSGAPNLLAQKVDAAVINAGDGTHEHPTQALLDAVTIRRRRGRLAGLRVAICGDVLHSRVARSNIHLLTTMGSHVRLVGPPTLIPAAAEKFGVEVFHNMKAGLADVDIVMMLRLQNERMAHGLVPSSREFFRFFGLDSEKLAFARPDALVMHPGPMNRGVEIASVVADDPLRSLIREQVEMGVAVRMAVLDTLSRVHLRNAS